MSWNDLLFLIALLLLLAALFGRRLPGPLPRYRWHLAIAACVVFAVALYFGWNDAVRGFQDGYNAGRH